MTNISFSTRELTINNNDTVWKEVENSDHNTAVKLFSNHDWKTEELKLNELVENNPSANIFSVSISGVNIYNRNNESELFIGCYESNSFCVSLSTFDDEKMQSNESSNITQKGVIKIIDSFFDEDYKSIHSTLSKRNNFKSDIEVLLEKRYDSKEELKTTTSKKQLLVVIILLMVLYLLFKYAF